MIRGPFWVCCVAWLGLVGCGDPVSNCVVKVEGVEACIPGQSSESFCKDTWGGEPSPADSSSDPTCEDLGYPAECAGVLTNEGEATATFNYYFAKSEADCESLDGATFHDRE